MDRWNQILENGTHESVGFSTPFVLQKKELDDGEFKVHATKLLQIGKQKVMHVQLQVIHLEYPVLQYFNSSRCLQHCVRIPYVHHCLATS